MYAVQFVLGVTVTILNGIKLFMIKRNWKELKPYEMLLFVLSASDTSLGILMLADAGYRVAHSKGKTIGIVDAGFGISMITSFVTMLLICIDRLIAVRLPLRHRALVTRGNIVKAGASLWVLTVLAFFVPVFLWKYASVNASKTFIIRFGAYGLLGFQGATIAIYGVVIWGILRNRQRIRRCDTTGRRESRNFSAAEKVAFVTCALTVSAFIVCTMPNTLEMLKVQPVDLNGQFKWQSCMFVGNAIANPLIYFFKVFITRKKIFR